MAQLNINDLYETARKKELNKFKTFDTILKRCHNKIKNFTYKMFICFFIKFQ